MNLPTHALVFEPPHFTASHDGCGCAVVGSDLSRRLCPRLVLPLDVGDSKSPQAADAPPRPPSKSALSIWTLMTAAAPPRPAPHWRRKLISSASPSTATQRGGGKKTSVGVGERGIEGQGFLGGRGRKG